MAGDDGLKFGRIGGRRMSASMHSGCSPKRQFLYHSRFGTQIETAPVAEILDAWPG